MTPTFRRKRVKPAKGERLTSSGSQGDRRSELGKKEKKLSVGSVRVR